ncbi:hypothetical protein SEUCBS140593_008345 [Sporothrix eucalyptigena]|uniref:UmuC domain-containing protein n=1 Tax=Sporothrix eucalyptigena TaxID=1812306 RepID=A0ABP0CL48_9PEZI
MALANHPPPRRNDDRIILHFDYDCFYAQVVQNRAPGGALVGRSVGVTQKSILATCNYEARRRGVRKLMRITEARRICPDIVLVDGEDLSPFRDVSKQLYRLVRDAVGPGAPVERLGLDEVFVDATALVDANLERLLARYASAGIATSKLLSKLAGKVNKPANQTVLVSAAWSNDTGRGTTAGFEPEPDLNTVADSVVWQFMDPLPLRSIPGIGFKTSTLLNNFIISKRAAARKEDIVDTLEARDKSGNSAENQEDDELDTDDEEESDSPTVTVEDIRTFPGMSPRLLDTILGGSKSRNHKGAGATTASSGNIPTGSRVWGLLHGVDDVPVRGGRDLPTQISIENTYAGPRQGTLQPDAATAVSAELHKLATSLLRRMHVDLVESTATSDTTVLDKNKDKNLAGTEAATRASWLARPRTLRLTLRPQMPEAVDNRAPYNYFARMSRSQPLPGFVFSLTTPLEQVVGRLVTGTLVPMFRKLAASVHVGKLSATAITAGTSSRKGLPAWTVGLLNVCVANMAPVAGRGDDIAAMFKRQDNGTGEDFGHHSECESDRNVGTSATGIHEDENNAGTSNIAEGSDREDDSWDTGEDADGCALEMCGQCGHLIPVFALEAHERYHTLGD